ncbi:MAG: DUF89 family protein [Chitinivibrionales bacterium]|nr:DUF89 family protein [Chitinivibrionales bacterium]
MFNLLFSYLMMAQITLYNVGIRYFFCYPELFTFTRTLHMKFYLDCYPCLLRMALNTAQVAGLGTIGSKAIIDKVMRLLIDRAPHTTPPHLVAQMYSFIQEELHEGSECFDPYRKIKASTNSIALSHEQALFDIVNNSQDKPAAAIKVAAAGNIIDFGAKDHGSVDVDREIENIPNLEFSIFDYELFLSRLNNARQILYIGDNSGETVFDKVLLDYIAKSYPSVSLTYAVRERPVINDATREDALLAKIDSIACVISSGSIYPGTVLEEASSEFKKLFWNADIIISKGQGNLETLLQVDNEKIFFILRIKCKCVARDLNTDIGSLILWKKPLLKSRENTSKVKE